MILVILGIRLLDGVPYNYAGPRWPAETVSYTSEAGAPRCRAHFAGSKEGKIVFQSCFMLTTIHPLATASLRMSGRGDPLLYIAAEFVGCHAGVGGGHDRQHALLAARRDALRITLEQRRERLFAFPLR